jgi:predicted PurR-regulated permease PerM
MTVRQQSNGATMTALAGDGQTHLATLRRSLGVISLAVLVAIVPFLSGLVGALILYSLTRRLHDRASRRIAPRASALLITTTVTAMILIPGAWLISSIIAESAAVVRSWRPEAFASLLAATPLRSLGVEREIDGIITAALGWLSTRAFTFVGGVTAATLNTLLALLGLYYLLLDAGSLWGRVKTVAGLPDEVAALVANRFSLVTDGLILGTMLTAALQGSVVGVAFALVGFQAPLLWGFVTACASVLPVLGSALVWLPGAIVLVASHRIGAAVLVGVLGAGVASNIDNLVRPLVYRSVSGVHPMLTLVGAFAGVRLFGVMGAFIGPLVLSGFAELIGVYENAVHTAAVTVVQPSPGTDAQLVPGE